MRKIIIVMVCVLIVGLICMCYFGQIERKETILPTFDKITSDIPEGSSVEELFSTIQRGLVSIEQKGIYGSGLLWKQEGSNVVIVTAGHVITDVIAKNTIGFMDGSQWKADCLLKSEEEDVAFLQMELIQEESIHWEKYCVIDFNTEVTIVKDEVLFYLNRENEICEITVVDPKIYLEDFQSDMIRCMGEANHGMSGNGVFNKEGKFIGLICGSSEFGELAILPAGLILSEYEKVSH